MAEFGEVVERGTVPCRRCRRIHDRRKDPKRPGVAATWADPHDGHAYDSMRARELVAWLVKDSHAALAAIRRDAAQGGESG